MHIEKWLLIALPVCSVCMVGAQEDTQWETIINAALPYSLKRYDVGDYVQNGLVGHFDAVRNAGADLPHDANAVTWKNLVNGPDAEIVRREGDASGWKDKSFFFAGRARAYLNEPGIGFGSTGTWQFAIDADYRVQEAKTYPIVFGDLRDCGVYYDQQGNIGYPNDMVAFKLDPYTGGGYHPGNRAKGSVTEGRYLTVQFGASKEMHLFTGTDPIGGYNASAANVPNIPATRWTWGGSLRDDYNENGTMKNPLESIRYFRGDFHSVRLYNRMLTESELQQNRKVDDARFRDGCCNVQLRSATSGAAGTEDDGAYDVNGIYEFTRPGSVTVGEAVYSPAGYQLEVWNAEKKAWMQAGTFPGSSFTYTNCLARSSVRVTWLWEISGGKLKLDALAYAPLGLIGNFDGISNAGADVPHDSAATTWKNLVAGPNATITKRAGDASSWGAKGFNFAGRARAFMDEPGVGFGSQITLQFALDVDYRNQQESGMWPILFGGLKDFGVFYKQVTSSGPSKTLQFGTECFSSLAYNKRLSADRTYGHFLTVMACAYGKQGFLWDSDPEDGAVSDFSASLSIPVSRWGWGGSPRDDYNENGTLKNPLENIRFSKGFYNALRMYNRTLTDNELALNRIIDAARFRGLQTVSAKGLVEIAGSAAKNASDDDTICLLKSGSMTATAPASVVCDGITYTCTGYRLETVNNTYGFYETTATGTETTYTIEANDAVNRRLTWQWRTEGRLRTGNDYDVGDYVQEGLVAHFDAIRNAGADLPHDASLMTWKNLVNGMADAGIVKRTGDTSAWTDNAYDFAGLARAYVDAPGIGFGSDGTWQLAMDVDYMLQKPDTYPYVFGDLRDCGIFYSPGSENNPNSEVTFKLDPYTGGGYHPGNRAKGSVTEGRYLTVQFGASKEMHLFTGTNPIGGYNASAANVPDVPAMRWTWGGSLRDDYNENGTIKNPLESIRYTKGKYHSVRLYNRILTENELERNRKIDDVRFHGAVITNVVVASAHDEAHGVEADGVYAVDGSWTFTVKPTVLQSGKTVRPSGYTIETMTPQGWGNRTSHAGTSYTWTEGDAPVRLTWRYAKSTMIVLR